jgi:hypothetical protein
LNIQTDLGINIKQLVREERFQQNVNESDFKDYFDICVWYIAGKAEVQQIYLLAQANSLYSELMKGILQYL